MVVVSAIAKHTATVIFLHGLGDTGNGWRQVAMMLGPQLPHVKWVLPDSPVQPVTLNGGHAMPSWFDIRTLHDVAESEDEKGLIASVRRIEAIIAEESRLVPAKRIVLGGFSQGCAVSVLTTMLHAEQLGGLVALSGWLPLRAKLTEHNKGTINNKTPVFWGHGTEDQTVKYEFGAASVKYLREQLHFDDVDFKSYGGMGHMARPDELVDIAGFLKRTLPR